jgi:glycosyltransferase involved in cell wall biosynthesis
MQVPITVIVPTHNRRETVLLAVESALGQTRRPEQVIVIAEGCTDGTQEALRDLGHPGLELLDVPERPGYGYGYRNEALRRARGDAVAWLGDDDLYLPDHLERVGELFDVGAADIVQATGAVVREDDSLDGTNGDWGVPYFRERLLAGENRAPASTVSHLVASAEEAGGWRAELDGAADTDLWRRMVETGARPGMVATPTVLSFQARDRRLQWSERVEQYGRFLERLRDPAELVLLRREMARAAHKRIAAADHRAFHLRVQGDMLREEAEALRKEVERLERTLDLTLSGGWWRLRNHLLPLLRAGRAAERRLRALSAAGRGLRAERRTQTREHALCANGTPMYRDALDLLTPARFDIPAKLIYARHWERGVTSAWHRELYDRHIRAWNGYFEAEPPKDSSGEFFSSFHEVLRSIRSRGFDPSFGPVPIGATGSPINGGHRIAASILYKQRVLCEHRRELLPSHYFGFYYFRDQTQHGTLPDGMLDAMATEYCRLKPSTFVAVVFPSAEGDHELAQTILSQHGELVYEKSLELGGQGPINLMRLLYSGEPWLGSDADAFAGARAKAEACFGSQQPTRLSVLEGSGTETMARAKKAIRERFGIGNHSIHITDSHEETVRVAETVFNANGVHLLECRRLVTLAGFELLIDELRAWFRRHSLDPEDSCIGGSGTLAAYGLRECRDLDLLHKYPLGGIGTPEEIGSHNEYLRHYPLPGDDIIYDPSHHFMYRGVKFASARVVAGMKARRGEEKDIRDLELMVAGGLGGETRVNA